MHVFSQILETVICQKVYRKKLLLVLHRLQIKQINVKDYIKKKIDALIIPVAIESLLCLTPSLEALKPAEILTDSKSACPTVLHLSFLLYNNNSITISNLIKGLAIPTGFRNGNISYTSLEF